jgi:hypothetical protein
VPSVVVAAPSSGAVAVVVDGSVVASVVGEPAVSAGAALQAAANANPAAMVRMAIERLVEPRIGPCSLVKAGPAPLVDGPHGARARLTVVARRRPARSPTR